MHKFSSTSLFDIILYKVRLQLTLIKYPHHPCVQGHIILQTGNQDTWRVSPKRIHLLQIIDTNLWANLSKNGGRSFLHKILTQTNQPPTDSYIPPSPASNFMLRAINRNYSQENMLHEFLEDPKPGLIHVHLA